mmetsp:Transcript_943/g.2353  ORF Transcript_943/g.2353 Transcript_943/m.2353 type:complete len:211 (+) Transcript_943:29-661(+)
MRVVSPGDTVHANECWERLDGRLSGGATTKGARRRPSLEAPLAGNEPLRSSHRGTRFCSEEDEFANTLTRRIEKAIGRDAGDSDCEAAGEDEGAIHRAQAEAIGEKGKKHSSQEGFSASVKRRRSDRSSLSMSSRRCIRRARSFRCWAVMTWTEGIPRRLAAGASVRPPGPLSQSTPTDRRRAAVRLVGRSNVFQEEERATRAVSRNPRP